MTEDLKRQVVAGANGCYEYPKLRESLVALVPQVHRDGDRDRRWSRFDADKSTNKVHLTGQEGQREDDDGEEELQAGADGQEDADQLEYEAEVLLTHAARKRAAAEKNRGFQKPETEADRSKRIENMKAKMACAACRSHGHIRYGHWHGDEACPYYDKNKAKTKPVFVVSQEAGSEEDSDDAFVVHACTLDGEAHQVHAVVLASNVKGRSPEEPMALADTCCARTVAGRSWAEKHMKLLTEKGIPYLLVPDRQHFRFGSNPRVKAFAALICPIYVSKSHPNVLLRMSIVDQDIPLLVSATVLKAMGAVVDMGKGNYHFQTLGVGVKMIQTSTGHIGFNIMAATCFSVPDLLCLDWRSFNEAGSEIAFCGGKDQGLRHVDVPVFPTHRGSDSVGIVEHVHMTTHGTYQHTVTPPVLKPVDTSSSESPESFGDAGSFQLQHGPRPKEEGRVCGEAQHDDVHPPGHASGNVSREVAHGVPACQADHVSPASCKLEAVQQAGASEAVCRKGDSVGRVGSSDLLRSPAVEQGSIGGGVDFVRRGGGQGRCGHSSQSGWTSNVSKLPHQDDQAGEPHDSGAVLGMHHLSPVQADLRDGVLREASSRSPEEPREGWLTYLKGELDRWRGGDGRSNSSSRCKDSGACHERGELGTNAGWSNAADCGGEGADREAAQGSSLSCQSAWQPNPESEAVIRSKIRDGIKKRKLAKRGTWKRLTGNCTALLTAVAFFTSTCFAAASEVVGDHRPDVIEIFGGAGEVSMHFARRGWDVVQPVDLQYGMDLKDPEVRSEVVDLVRKRKPRFVLVEWPCKLWGKLTDINYNTPQRKRKLHKLRQEERPFLEMTEQIFREQQNRGDEALAENPLASHAFREAPIRRILDTPGIHVGISHGCQYNFRNVNTGELLKKPTMWIATSEEMVQELSLKCPNRKGCIHHEHGQCLGSKVTTHAAVYTKELAKAIHRGFLRTIRRKEPGRIKRLLDSVHARLVHGDSHDLVWKHDKLKSVRDQVQQVFVGNASDVKMEEEEEKEVGGSGSGDHLFSDGITFEVPEGRKLDPGVRSVIRKLHCNLGHPSVKDMQRFMRNGGAPQEMVEAVGWLRCVSCARSQRPRTHRTVRIPPHDIQFNDQIMVDCFHVKDPKHEGHWFMSMLDRSTMYHLVTPIPDHSPQTFIKVFMRDWAKWAGNPVEISIDLERGFGSQEFADVMGKAGTAVVPIAGQAHWQHGKIERHGAIVKTMLTKVLSQNDGVTPEEVGWLANEVTMAKNMLVREHGFSPAQLVFGKEPRLYGEIEANGEPCGFHFSAGEPGTQLAKRMRFRTQSRQAYVNAQASAMLSQTARNRTRPWKEPQIGDRCFFFREVRSKHTKGVVKKWLGPALVVGVQGQSNLWVVFGGKCFLVAQEHTREAIGEEMLYGKPEIQEALTVFKGMMNVSGGGTYVDTTQQVQPMDEDFDMVPQDDEHDNEDENVQESSHVVGNPNRRDELPNELRDLFQVPGWKEDIHGHPVCVAYKSYAYRTPPPRIEGTRFPFRSTWGYWGGSWRLLEDEVRWLALEDATDLIPGGPADVMVSVFKTRTRKQECLDSVPACLKKQKTGRVDQVFLTLSQRKAQKALDKEVPYDKIPEEHKQAYAEAERKEWDSWLQYDAVEVLSAEASDKVVSESKERVLRSRFVLRNKNAGLRGEDGNPLPLRAKARLCVQGQNCPDCATGNVRVDAPTVQQSTLTLFLHLTVSLGWMQWWRNGDISSAFLQGAESTGEPLYMYPPARGLPGLSQGQVLRLKRPVYGRPDAPRAWYMQLSGFIVDTLGFTCSVLDPAFFVLRDKGGSPHAMIVLHVDDLMVSTDGSDFAEEQVRKLYDRFPFGEWATVQDVPGGVTYCGKEIVVEEEGGEKVIRLRQRGFVNGRLDLIPIEASRKQNLDAVASPSEISDFRSVMGALQWVCNQTRPDVAFMTNQLQKRISKLQVRDLVEANKVVRIVKHDEVSLTFRNLGKQVAVVVWHDSGLFNSCGMELDENDDGVIHSLADKKMLYSQKGSLVGLVRQGDIESTEKIACNFLAWRSKTNRRIVESSFSAETHGATMGHSQGHYLRMLLLEVFNGDSVVKQENDWNLQIPLVMCTDCRSIYDCLKKDGQTISDKSSAINVAVLRQLCGTERTPSSDRARVLWVPTRHQCADPLTKSGLHGAMQLLREGKVCFHAKSAKALKSRDNVVSVGT